MINKVFTQVEILIKDVTTQEKITTEQDREDFF